MSSVGELTGVAAFEVMKRLGPEKVGMGCVSALATDVPNHFRTMQGLEKVIVIDGCTNSCVRRIMEAARVKTDGYFDLGKHLRIKMIGPFKPVAYTGVDPKRAVEAIIAKIQGLQGGTK